MSARRRAKWLGVTAHVAAFLFVGPVWGEDWPQFRGPTGQGLSTEDGLPLRWSATQNVAWKTAIPGAGWSSPVQVGGRIYVTTAVEVRGGDLSLRALCLDAGSGAILWDKEVFVEPAAQVANAHRKNSQASPTPVVEGGALYVHFGHMGTARLDLEGNKVWENRSVRYPPVHGNGGGPALVGDRLVFAADGAHDPFVVALDSNTGDELWRTPRPGDASKKFSFSTPLAVAVGDKTQLVIPGSGVVQSLDPADGSEIWRVRYDEGYSVVPRPASGLGLVFFSSGFDDPVLYAVRPDGQGDVTATHVVWKASRSAPLTPSPLVVGDEIYYAADNGVATCADAKTGEVHWQERVCGPVSASPLHAGGHVYFQDEQGASTVVEAGTRFQVVSKNDLEEKTLASYAVGDACLFIRTADHLYRIGPR